MKIFTKLFCAFLLFNSQFSHGQSIIEFQSGTIIEVTAGADICADNVTIQGTYTGIGTLCNGPLPVELSLFTATFSKNEINLFWKTETEVDNYGFEIERRIDDKDWNQITFVVGNGNSNSPKEYSFSDKDLFAGGSKFQYRLKQIDNDGSFDYSNVVEVEVVPDQYELSQNYPNPFNPSTVIEFSLPEDAANAELSIYNTLGEKVAELVNTSLATGRYQYQWNGQNVASGTYIYKLRTDQFTSVKKMLLLK
jgi:hypothetical protein